MCRTLLSIFIFLLLFFAVNSFSEEIEWTVQITDRPYRILEVRPFINANSPDPFYYLSSSFQVFSLAELGRLRFCTVRTSSIQGPTNLPPDHFPVLEKSTNPLRSLVCVSEAVARSPDFVLYGTYTAYESGKGSLNVVLSNVLERRIEKKYVRSFDPFLVLDEMPSVLQPVAESLTGQKGKILLLDSQEKLVEVVQDKEFLGFTPLSLFVRESGVDLEFRKKGFRSIRTRLNSDLPGNEWVLPPLDPLKTIPFTVRTFPPRAGIYLDEIYLGRSPLKKVSVFPGDYILHISKSNYRSVTRKISLPAASPLSVHMPSPQRTTGFFTPERLAWTSFSLGICFLGYSLYHSMQAEYLNRKNTDQVYDRKIDLHQTKASWGIGFTVPCLVLTLSFNFRHSNSRDW